MSFQNQFEKIIMTTGSKALPLSGIVNYLHPTVIGIVASALLTLLVIVGSRNLKHFNSALFGDGCNRARSETRQHRSAH